MNKMNGVDSVPRSTAALGAGKDTSSIASEDVPWIESGSHEYESKRKIYNLENTSTPFAISCPRNAQDVAVLVKHALKSDIAITVRGGGHDLFGRSVLQSALCIDMRGLDFVEIASDKKSARIGGGILMGKLMHELSREGLITPFGSVPSLGYFGWASLGGHGALSGQWGLGVDQIIAAEIVDASGNIVRADHQTLKGIRGAGGNFGIVVSLEIKLYELKTLLAGLIILDSSASGAAETLTEFMSNFRSYEASGQFPGAATIQPFIANHPEMGRTIMITYVWSSPDFLQGKEVLEKLLKLAPVVVHTVAETSVDDWLNLLESFCPYGVFGGDKGISFRQLTPKILEIVGRHVEKMPSDAGTAFSIHSLNRSSPSATNGQLGIGSCFNPEARHEHFVLELIGSAVEKSRLPESQKWIREMYDELKESGEAMEGTYVALANPEDMSVEKIYGSEWQGLLELKMKLDPQGIFKNAVPRIWNASSTACKNFL